MSNPTPVALMSRPPTLESRKLLNRQPTPGPSKDAMVLKSEPVTCSRPAQFQTPDRVTIHPSPLSEAISGTSKQGFMALEPKANIYSSLPQQPSTSQANDVHQQIPMSSCSAYLAKSTRKSPPTITKDCIGVANASPPVLKLLNDRLRAKLDLQRCPVQIPDHIVPMNRPALIRCYGSSKSLQKNVGITKASNSSTIKNDSEIKLDPFALTETTPPLTDIYQFPKLYCSIDEPLAALESVQVEAVDPKPPLSTPDDTTICSQPVSDAIKKIVSLSPSKPTAPDVPKSSSAPTPRISPSTSPDFLGFRRQDLRYSDSLLKIFTDAQAGHQPTKRGKRPTKITQSTPKASIRPKRQHTSSIGSQTGDESTIELNSSVPNVHTIDEVVASSAKVLATMKLDPDEADDEISDIESQKTTRIDPIEKITQAVPVSVEIKETVLAPKPVAIAKGKYRRIKAIPVPVTRKRVVVLASVEAVLTTQGEASIDFSESTEPIDSVEQATLTPLVPAVHNIVKETEKERQIKTKKMQAMLSERTSLQSHPRSVALTHEFTTPSERPRTAVQRYTTSDDDSSEATTHLRPQRPKRQFRKVATSIDTTPNTDEMSEDCNINIEALNDRSNVLVEQVAKCFTFGPKVSRRLESTSSATSDVDNSFVKYLARLSASKDRSERDKDKNAEVLMKDETVEADIATTVPAEGKTEITEPKSHDSVNNSMHPKRFTASKGSEGQYDQSTEIDQIEEELEECVQPDIAYAQPTHKENEISEAESLENVDWIDDTVNNVTPDVLFTKSGIDEDDVKPSISRKRPRPSIVSLLAERLDRDTLMADILRAEYSRFICISSDDSSDEDNEVEVHQILGPAVVPDDEEQYKATDDSTDFIIPERDSGIVRADTIEADVISVDPSASEFEHVIEETAKAEKCLPNDEMQINVPVSDKQTDIVNEPAEESDLVLDEPCFVDNEFVDESCSEFVAEAVNIKDATQVILMESEVETTVEIATTGEDAEDVSEQNAVDMVWSLGVSNQIQSTSYDTMLNSSTESSEDIFVGYEPTGIEVDHRSWKENNVTPSQGAVTVSTVLDGPEKCDDHLDNTINDANKEKISETSSRDLDSEEFQQKILLDMGQHTSTVTVDCHEQPTSLGADIGDIEVQNSIEDSSAFLQEVIQEELPDIEIKKPTKKKRICIKPLKIPRKSAKIEDKPSAEERTKCAVTETMKTVQRNPITQTEDDPMVDIPLKISYSDQQASTKPTITDTPVTATKTEDEVESQPASSITPAVRIHARANKTLHTNKSGNKFEPKKRLLSKDSVSSDDMLLGRQNRSRAHIIDSDDENAAKSEVKKEEANTELTILDEPTKIVTHSELPASLSSKRKRTVKSYADFFTDDNPTHKVDDTPPTKRVRKSVNNEEIVIVTPRTKRGRKAKLPETPTNTDEQSSNSATEIPSELPIDTEIPDEVKPTPKRGRKPKITPTPTTPADENSAPTSPSHDKPTPKRIFGRKPAEKPTEPSIPPIVTCGNCKEEMESSKWNAHVSYHYGLAWLDGIETAVVSICSYWTTL